MSRAGYDSTVDRAEPQPWRPAHDHARGPRLDVLCSLAWRRADRRVARRQDELAIEALRLYHRLVAELDATFDRQLGLGL